MTLTIDVTEQNISVDEVNQTIAIQSVGAKGDKGDTGATGAAGQDGSDGADGQAATIQIGTVTTLPAGQQATVTNVGTPNAAILNMAIPQGEDGAGGGAAWGFVTGDIEDQTDLSAALAAKASSSHSHAIADVTGLQTALDSKPDNYLTDGMFQLCVANDFANYSVIGIGSTSGAKVGFWQANPDDATRRAFGQYARIYTSTTINQDAGFRAPLPLTPHIGANNCRNGGYVETSFMLKNNGSGQQRFVVGLIATTSSSAVANNASLTSVQGVALTIDQNLGDTTWFYTHNRNAVAPVRSQFQSAPIAFDTPYLVSFELLASNQVKIRLKNLYTGITYTETITVAWALNFYEFYPQIFIRNLVSGQLNEFNWNKTFSRRTFASW